MSFTGLEVFDTTLQKTSIWLNNILEQTGWTDRHRAYSALRGVLHALRDRLTVAEAVDLGAQLPVLVRGVYYEGWRPAGKPFKYRHREEFFQQVSKGMPDADQSDLEKGIRAVFKILAEQISSGEIQQVKKQLPEVVRELWQ